MADIRHSLSMSNNTASTIWIAERNVHIVSFYEFIFPAYNPDRYPVSVRVAHNLSCASSTMTQQTPNATSDFPGSTLYIRKYFD